MKLVGRVIVQGSGSFDFPEKDDGGTETGKRIKGRNIRVFERGETETYLFTLGEEVPEPEPLVEIDAVFEFRKYGKSGSLRLVNWAPAGPSPLDEKARDFWIPGQEALEV